MRSKVEVARWGRLLAVRVTGYGTWREAQALDAWAKDAAGPETADLVVELTAARQLDSTFVGTLVGLARFLASEHRGEVALYGVSPAVEANLRELGLHVVITNIHAEPWPQVVQWEELPTPEPPPDALLRHVLGAHEQLMAIDEGNVERFEESVRMLRASLTPASAEQMDGNNKSSGRDPSHTSG